MLKLLPNEIRPLQSASWHPEMSQSKGENSNLLPGEWGDFPAGFGGSFTLHFISISSDSELEAASRRRGTEEFPILNFRI